MKLASLFSTLLLAFLGGSQVIASPMMLKSKDYYLLGQQVNLKAVDGNAVASIADVNQLASTAAGNSKNATSASNSSSAATYVANAKYGRLLKSTSEAVSTIEVIDVNNLAPTAAGPDMQGPRNPLLYSGKRYFVGQRTPLL